MALNMFSGRDTLPEKSSFEVKTLVDEAPVVTWETVQALKQTFSREFNMGLVAFAVRDLMPEIAELYGGAYKYAMLYGNSVIVDAGKGIGALADAVPQEDQEFSNLDVNAALREAGLLEDGEKYLEMGTSGAVLENGRGAEVISTVHLDVREDLVKSGSLSKAAWSDEDGEIHVDSHGDSKRVLLENKFIVKKGEVEDSNGIFVVLDFFQDNEANLYEVIAEAAKNAGLENYTVRATVEGPVKLKLAVITALPEEPIQDMDGVRDILAVHDVEVDETFHFVGSRSAEISRQNERWGEITGNPVYSPNGHYHGYTESGSVGGHVLSVVPQSGAKVGLVIEPAKVVQVVEKEA